MTAQKGSTVKVHYTGTLKADGSQFDSSEGREPLEFKLGEGMVIAGFEKAVLGKSVGDNLTVEITPEEGYGNPNDELVFPSPQGTASSGCRSGRRYHAGNPHR